MPMAAAGMATLVVWAGLLPRVTVKTRVPSVVPVWNETDGPFENCPVDVPSATVKVAERVPSAKTMAGSSLTPLRADWNASVTVPLPLDADRDASIIERLPRVAPPGG